MKLKKGDQIVVVMGKDKGKKGAVESVNVADSTVVVPGVNLYKRHRKKVDEKRAAAIVEIAVPLAFAKVQIICPKCKKPTRVGYTGTGKDKHRICKKCKQLI